MSPDHDLTKESLPLLLAHGDQDDTVIDQHSFYLAELGKKLATEVTLIHVLGAGHGFHSENTTPGSAEIVASTADFLADCVAKAQGK